jgi:hypothetical protein
MNFKDIKKHCEDEGCIFEKVLNDVYLVRNVINGQFCFVENLKFYNTPTLHTYFYELGVPYPESIIDSIHVYLTFRKKIDN